MVRPERIEPLPGQESVWDYPRPPRLEPAPNHLVVQLGSTVVAESRRALRVLETSHPPTYYFPPDDIAVGALAAVTGSSFCEWKGVAGYFDVVTPDARLERAAWSYPQPSAPFAALGDHVAFYPHILECLVDGERATPQNQFYGGWITSHVAGPFKGPPGTERW
jgi:uncharacterized protein (DUF427 family)